MRRRARLGTPIFTKPGAFEDKLADARAMRQAPTQGEVTLWAELRARRLGGWRFRRQQVIAGYVVDFYCAELRLAVEVDGGVHELRGVEDAQRDEHLGALGVYVMRVRDADVVGRLETVLRAIALHCESHAVRTGRKRREGHRTPKRR